MTTRSRILWSLLLAGSLVGCREAAVPLPIVERDNEVCCAPPPDLRRPEFPGPAAVVELVNVTSDRHEFVVRGVDAALLASLQQRGDDTMTTSLAVRTGADTDLPAMLGEHAVVGGTLVFRPRFPLAAGLVYYATWDPRTVDPSARPVTTTIEIPSTEREPTARVVEVFPSGDVLPENLLRIYVHFSEPMSRGRAYEHLHLLDANGDEVEAPFLELGEELWNRDATRFTLLLDPGRIKRDLKPNLEVGPPVRAGGTYSIVVDRDWLDGHGRPLVEGHRKAFRVERPDTVPPDPRKWALSIPESGGVEPLHVTFDGPLDRALLDRLLTITGPDGEPLTGTAMVMPHELGWQFVPDEPWAAGRHELIVDSLLEDPSGNSVGRPFEVDLSATPSSSEGSDVRLPFEVEP